jgi:Uma2 family endonuclease
MKVRVSEKRYFHPDVTVTCDARDRGTTDLIQSPRLVVEVLSPSTEARDRGRKLQSYLALPSVEAYLLVDPRTVRVEIYLKEQRKWVYDAFVADDEIVLASLGVRFPIVVVYEDVVFEDANIV